jgi:outer membrane protein OmpA-like peptidoglycan-associated protein
MHPVSLAVVAMLFIAGCSTPTQAPVASLQTSTPEKSYVVLSGPSGDQIATGAQGSMVAGVSWSAFRDYSFNSYSDAILRSDSAKARDIADYLNRNPSARVAIDGYNPSRAAVVRTALLNAGVPDHKIQVGAYVEPQDRRLNNVVVLVSN